MKKIKSFFRNLLSEDKSLHEFRSNNTPTLNKFDRITSFILFFVCLIIWFLGILGSCNVVSADEPITYLGGSKWVWQGRSIEADTGRFYDLNGELTYTTSSGDSYTYPFYELYFGFSYISSGEGSLKPVRNYITIVTKLGQYKTINLGTTSTLTFHFIRDTDVHNLYWDLFNPSLISVMQQFTNLFEEPGPAFIINSGEYFFTRFRDNTLRNFNFTLTTDYSEFTQLSFSTYDPITNIDVQPYQIIRFKASLSSEEEVYAYRDLPSGMWVDSEDSTYFPSINITEDYIVYYESQYTSFSRLFSLNPSSDGSSFEDGFAAGLEQGFIYNFFDGIFKALDAFPITSTFSLFDLLSSLIGFFIILWLLKLLAGG